MFQTLQNFTKLLLGYLKECDRCEGNTYVSGCCRLKAKKVWRSYKRKGKRYWKEHYQCTYCGQFCREMPCGQCEGAGVVEV